MKKQNMVGQKMKSFTFLSVLGAGAWAVVYQAIDQRDNSQVAIKAIPKQLMVETPKLQQLVKTQIKVLKSCHNQNVIRFVDTFMSEKMIFIVTEYCNGGDLQHYLESKKRLTQDQATNFLKQIINGFKGLHEVGAMHRDFKTANVLLHNSVCKIADLGFAKQMQKKSLAKTILGTSLTMAPQVLDERPYGMEADLWSIGVVYYQLIYGKYPYNGMNDYDILKKIKNSRPDYSAVQISSQCRDFIDKCLTVDPKKRISWRQVYDHPLLTKSEGRFIYGGLKSKISIGSNKNYYENNKNVQAKNQFIYPQLNGKIQKSLLDVVWQDGGDIRQSMNMNALIEEAEQKKKKQLTFGTYQKKYMNKRNNIMFIFKFVVPYMNTILKYKANHGIALFITSKKSYIDMKKFIMSIQTKKNIFQFDKYWDDFIKSSIYVAMIKQFQGDLQMIEAQALSFQFDIQIQSKQIQAECDLNKIASKNFDNLVNETINQYWFLLAQNLDNSKGADRQVLIRVLQALLYYKDNKIADIQGFDKIMEVLNYGDAQKNIKEKLFAVYQ